MEKAFLNYVATFDQTQLPIKRKREHTLRTANDARHIARELGLDKKNIELAYAIAMLHDIGRFTQWTLYKTFSDLRSVDHGNLAVKILFEDGLVERFKLDKKLYPIIRFAVQNHNKFAIDTTDVPYIEGFDALLHAQIIRDADKVDIARISTSDEVKDVQLVTADNVTTGISPLVMQDVKNKQQARHINMRTKADSIIGSISFAYDLYTKPAKKIFIDNEYPIGIFEGFKFHLNAEDAQAVRQIAEKVMRDLRAAV